MQIWRRTKQKTIVKKRLNLQDAINAKTDVWVEIFTLQKRDRRRTGAATPGGGKVLNQWKGIQMKLK